MTQLDRVLVAGLGVSGRAARDVLTARGSTVLVADDHTAELSLDQARQHLSGVDLIVVSPGIAPHHPLLVDARAAGLPVWSEVELAWHLRVDRRDGGGPAPWLAVTGTNGKTTTVEMLTSILTAHGERAAAVGNVGTPVVLAATDPDLDVLAVELSSFQLHHTESMAAEAAAVLNLAADHLDWHGSMAAYAADKGRIFTGVQRACIYNAADPATEDLVREADVADGAIAVGFTLSTPGLGQVGLVEDVLVDRGFAAERRTHAAELATFADLAHLAPGGSALAPHTVQNALAAAALALAHGVSPASIRQGLRDYRPGAHRIATVAELDGVRWVDDSKATNAHAAAASLAAFAPGSVVWIAGGLAKGAHFDDLVRSRADRLAAVVLIGVDPEPLGQALARHAPQVPVVRVDPGETGTVMARAVHEARRFATDLAAPDTTVLLAPACASMDQFSSYAERGEAFAAEVRAIRPAR
ncbi:UDP-N-acetylmuramoyl-L-alanine--D-glutamate ligase [Cellulomonas sp. NPDC089187]|uniref:UDP-N-acetylmuramoyl-L-alanine--D-glutamate ligase n=1 Tax=Cellulomonas sp. NPDC089187 TaxID=3154970 RepID=UPI0034418B37